MQLRAFWRFLIAATAVVFLFGGPTQAQTATSAQASAGKPLALGKYVKHRSRHVRKSTTRSSHHSSKKTARKSSASRRSAKAKSSADNARNNDAKDSAKTASVRKAAEQLSAVADARAELKSDDQQPSATPVNEMIPAAAATPEVSGAQTLTDLDKAAMAATTLDTSIKPPTAATPVKMVSTASAAEPSAYPAASQAVSNHDDVGDTWDKTSLIGKIFVAFGGLLTLASAARMFMA